MSRNKEIKENSKCDCNCVHENVVNGVRNEIATPAELDAVSRLYKTFGNRTRLNILAALNCHEMCVCDLAVLMNMSKSAVSHQLRVLRENKLVTFEKQGRHSYYCLADDYVKDILDIALHHINEIGCEHREKVVKNEF